MTAHRTIGACLLAAVIVACAIRAREGIDVSSLTAAQRADYDVFAQRCSKCHSLARPLSSGIDEDAHWERYFERMRLTPGSGLTQEDKGPILRFLHYYSLEQRRRKAAAAAAAEPAPQADAGEARDGGAE